MMKESRYEIDIFWSDEDDAYIAVVPDLPYCSAWGETYEEALAQVRVAIRGHLKVAEKYGDPIPEPKARPREESGTGPKAEIPPPPLGLPNEDWHRTYRRLLIGCATVREDKWFDDPLSTAESLRVVKVAAHTLGMSFEQFDAWIKEATEEEVRTRLLEEETVRAFHQELEKDIERLRTDSPLPSVYFAQ